MHTTHQRYDASATQEGGQVSYLWSHTSHAFGRQDVPSLSKADMFIRSELYLSYMERAVSVTHVEFEALRHVIMTIDVADLRARMVPEGDTVAEKRFDKGVANVAGLIANMAMRRQHKLPENHAAYIAKGE